MRKITKKINDEPPIGGTANRFFEESHAERAGLRRKSRPKPAGVGVGVAEVEDCLEFTFGMT